MINFCVVQCGILEDDLFTSSGKGTFHEVTPSCHNIGCLVVIPYMHIYTLQYNMVTLYFSEKKWE